MAKRIYSSRVKKWATAGGIAGVPLAVLLFWYLTTLGAIDITGISGDSICAGTTEDPCLAFINFSAKEDIFIYPSEDWSATPLYTDVQPKSVEMYRSWGKGWRRINLSKGCTGSWCGCYWCTKSNTAKFSYVFRNNTDYRIKYLVLKDEPDDTIKWGFGPIDPFWYGINETVANISVSNNLTMELGSQINVTTNITGASTVCVDIDHPEYGSNYTCGTPNANFTFNISYFRKNELNDSSTQKDLTYAVAGNQTVYIEGHQYDEMINFSINLTGHLNSGTYPEGVKIYINETLDKTIGPLRPADTDVSLDELNDSSTSEYVVYSGSSIARYFSLPKEANVSYAVFNFTGLPHWISDENFWANTASATNATSQENTQGNLPYGYDSSITSYGYAQSTTNVQSDSNWYANFTHNVSIPPRVDWRWRYSVPSVASGGRRQITSYCWDYNSGSWRTLSTRTITSIIPANFVEETITNTGSSKHCLDTDPIALRILARHVGGLGGGASTRFNMYEINTVDQYTGVEWFNSTGYPQNTTIEVGIVDGTLEGNYSGNLNVSHQTNDFNDSLTTALASCTADSNNLCDIPFYITEDSLGKYLIDTINITYRYNPNPIYLDIDLVSDFLNSSSGFSDVPIKFQSTTAGIINITDIKFDYAGGNDTIEIFTWDATATYCYQETANISTACGGLDSGNYVEDFQAGNDVNLIYDGNYGTYGEETLGSNHGYLYINYSKPSTSTSAKWQIKDEVNTTNLTITSVCFDLSVLQLRADSYSDFANSYTKWDCYNGTAWANLRNSGTGSNNRRVYEEAIFWNIPFNKSNNDTINLINYYSDWDYTYPSYVDYLEFIPNSPTSKNVTPYGQTTITPIFNITTYNYGNMNMNLSMKLNETNACINMTWNSTGGTKPSSGNMVNTSWQNLGVSLEYLNNTNVWLWVDYNCTNQLNWTWWYPELYIRGCCEDCEVCSEDMI